MKERQIPEVFTLIINTKMTNAGEALWAQTTDAGCRGYIHGSAFLSARSFSNLSEVIGIGTHSGLTRMMRASGIEEVFITGNASDYDKLEALCRVLPLWSGHPYYAAIHAVLDRLFDVHEPLTPNHLPDIWRHTAKHLFENPLTPANLPGMWGIRHLVTALSTQDIDDLSEDAWSELHGDLYLHLENLIKALWSPPYGAPLSKSDPAEDMIRRVAIFLDQYTAKRCAGIMVELSDLDAFVRPDPFSPAQAILRLQGKTAPPQDADQRLIISQTMRLLGRACIERGLKLVILNVSPEVIYPLCSYLYGCGCLPSTTVVLSHPHDLSSMGIKALLPVPHSIAPEFFMRNITAWASEMPLGALAGLYAPLCYPLDLPLWAEAGRTLCECVVAFGETGRGTRDFEEQAMLLKSILG